MKEQEPRGFADNKSAGVWEKTVDLLKHAQRLNRETLVGTDEAVFNPQVEYPSLPRAITFFSDIHFGSTRTDYEMLDRHLKIVDETPNWSMLTNGDDVNSFSAVFHASGMQEDPIPPFMQTHALIEKLKEMGQKDKLAVMSWGNHTDQSNIAGYPWLESFAREVNAPQFTSGGFLHFLAGEQHYGIAVSHMFWGKSRLNQTNENKRFREYAYPAADITVLGHTHSAEVDVYDRGGRDLGDVKAGTYKGFENDDWARQWGMGGRAGRPGITALLYPDRKHFQLFRDIEDAQQHLLGLIWKEEQAA